MKPGQKLIDIIKGNNTNVLTGSFIKELCCRHFNVSAEQIEGNCRNRQIVRARQAAIFLMKRFTDYSHKKIGDHFSGRDHTTICHSIQVVNNSIYCKDDYLYKDIQILEAACRSKEMVPMDNQTSYTTIIEVKRRPRDYTMYNGLPMQQEYVSQLFNNSKTHHANKQLQSFQ